MGTPRRSPAASIVALSASGGYNVPQAACPIPQRSRGVDACGLQRPRGSRPPDRTVAPWLASERSSRWNWQEG